MHKTVEHRRKTASVTMRTSQSLFSSNSVDVGTNLLLRVIEAHADRKFESCIDLGCGYGALGLSLAASGTARHVEMVDRDALAVEFTALNAAENGLEQVEAHSSLGLIDASSSRYDLIVSNLPGKAGSGVLQHLLHDASRLLEENGRFWGVIVNPVWPEIADYIEQPGLTTIHVEHGSRHTAFGFQVDNPAEASRTPELFDEIYLRDRVGFSVSGRTYDVETSRGVNEFDALSYSTILLLEQLNEMRRERWAEAVVFNVSQGYVPIALRASGMVGAIQLVDRDLLALRTSARNLQNNGLDDPPNSMYHQVAWLPVKPDSTVEPGLVVGMLRGDEPKEVLEVGMNSVAENLVPGGTAVIVGGSTPITRVLKSLGRRKDVRLLDRNRYRGSSVIVLRKLG